MNSVRIEKAVASDDGKMTPDPTRKTLALFGMFGVGNLGNECTLLAMLQNARRFLPNAEVCCICEGAGETALTYNIPSFPIREMPLPPMDNRVLRFVRRIFIGLSMELYRWFKAIKRLKGSAMLLMTGTGMLSDTDIHPLGLHYDILRWSLVAKLCRCKVMFVSVGVGPIRHPLSKFFVKAALGIADYRSYRDAFSKSYAEGMGISTKYDSVRPDLAFSLPKRVLPHARTRHGRGTVVGVGLITNDKRRASLEEAEAIYHDYITKIGTFVGWLIEHEHTVQFLVGDVAYDNRARQDVRAFLKRSGFKYEDRQIIDEPAQSVQELLSQLAGIDIVVASRFHNVLLSLMLSKPVVAISFHEKVTSLMSAMGLNQFCQDIEHVHVNKLIDQFTALKENAAHFKCELDRKSDTYRQTLEQQYDDIFNGN